MNDLPNKIFSEFKGKQSEAFSGVPEKYFEQLPVKINSRIRLKQKQRRQQLKIYTVSGIAAGLLIILGFSLFLVLQNPDNNTGRQVAENAGSVLVMKDSLLKDTLTAVKSNGGDAESEISDSATPTDEHDKKKYAMQSDLFDELDAIPIEVIFEYLDKHDEFEF
jgi:hypothetical protein